MSFDVNDTTSLSQLYHLNSEPWANENPVPNAPFQQKTTSYADAARVALPATEPGVVDQFARTRKSYRAFVDEPLSLATCAGILRSAYLALGPETAQGSKLLRRPVPSAGGLYPLEVYALVRNVTGLAKGIYHYDAVGDDLALLSTENWEDQASQAFLTWTAVAAAPMILCIGTNFARTQTKYGARGYRYVLFEAGHVAQNICLTAQELGLGSLCMGGYYDHILNRMVGLDGKSEAVVYTVAVGKPGDGFATN